MIFSARRAGERPRRSARPCSVISTSSLLSTVPPTKTARMGCAPDGPRDHFYRNSFTVLPAGVPYRPRTHDGHGLRLHPKPTVHGTQSAIVVSDGGPLLTYRDHRIKVQFPWQRGGDSSSGTPHPSGDDNAPGSGGAWTWVRVAT